MQQTINVVDGMNGSLKPPMSLESDAYLYKQDAQIPDVANELDAAFKEIDETISTIVGLEAVKDQLKKWMKGLLLFQRRKALGIKVGGPKIIHMAFLGNPGPGKTMVAQIVGKLLCKLRLVSADKLVEVQRTDLVGQYIGETGRKTREKIDKARGGVLFIDEAYILLINEYPAKLCYEQFNVNNVIIHWLHIHNIHPMPSGPTVEPGGKIQNVDSADGDAIRLVSLTKIWIDHKSLSQSQDGLIDVTRGSNWVTIPNNWFFNHDKVMLLGHDDGYVCDKNMCVTVVFNRIGPNCVQRMPRVRHGYAHVANNFYDGWRDYAIGGSMNPTIKSQGNLFVAPPDNNKAIEWREAGNSINVRSVGDAFLNGAHFRQLGRAGRSNYSRDLMFKAGRSSEVKQLTKDAGVLHCIVGRKC